MNSQHQAAAYTSGRAERVAGTKLQFGMRIGNGSVYDSGPFTVHDSSNTTCLGKNAGYIGLQNSSSSSSLTATAASTLAGSSSSSSASSSPTSSVVSVPTSAAPTSASSSSNVGAIAGGVLGSLAALAILAALLYIIYRQGRLVRAAAAESRAYDMSSHPPPPPEYTRMPAPSEEKATRHAGVELEVLD